jgi:hypothetical protein
MAYAIKAIVVLSPRGEYDAAERTSHLPRHEEGELCHFTGRD